MTPRLRTLPPGPGFWPELARHLAQASPDLSAVRVIVPTYVHIVHLREALGDHLGPSFIPPEIRTLSDWLAALPPADEPLPAAPGERLMHLYAQVRELSWLKKLFDAKRNSDLLPLARTLLSLSDELTLALLPAALAQPEDVEDRWRAALKQLSPQAAALLGSESQLVWNIWHAQRDARDPGMVRHALLQRLAAGADRPLFWCAPSAPAALDTEFLSAYAKRQPVTLFHLDWSASVLPGTWRRCWPEICDDTDLLEAASSNNSRIGLSLFPAHGLEHEAQSAASTVIGWLQQGFQKILIVPQDRLVARRLRALLERAQVMVADETGWKLSTTRAAAVLASWLELVASHGKPQALLDFIKSPFIFPDPDTEARQRLAIERALSRALPAGWTDIKACVNAPKVPAEAKQLIDIMVREAERFSGRRTLTEWVQLTLGTFDALGMMPKMRQDLAGAQVIAMVESLARECEGIEAGFSLAEWRALLNLQMEQAEFVAPRVDQRVRMVPLNGVPLREFDAAIIVGADAMHLPSPPSDTLFFANSVRRELGLPTREARARQQLRDFACLLLSCSQVVVSWRTQIDGEVNLVSPWIQRLQLALRQDAGLVKEAVLPAHEASETIVTLAGQRPQRPAPAAPSLLPSHLSASGYQRLVSCPYQFFASRMLRLSEADELNEQPEKRDYGQWLHQILQRYHEALTEQHTAPAERVVLMAKISDDVFDTVLGKQPAALGYAMRWKKHRTAYVQWANARESEGWQFALGEQEKKVTLNFVSGSMTLIGRLDRLDKHEDGRLAVLDYKTSEKGSLKKRLAGFEDHQLAFYGLLTSPRPAEASYVAIDSEKTEHFTAEPYQTWCESLEQRLKQDLDSIARGAALPASGAASSCEHCDARGLCRKGAW